jgi:carbon-monoxide dehydrogenase large subunit
MRRPVKWVETRSENVVCHGHGRAQRQRATIGGLRDGTLIAYRLEVTADAGAYPRVGAALPSLTVAMAAGPYTFTRVAGRGRSVVTNTAPVGAYRGAGRPEACAALERMVDLFATEIGMDPATVRMRNLVGPTAFPYHSQSGTTYDSGDYPKALATVTAALDYETLRAGQALRRARHETRHLGIGLAVYVEVTGMDSPEQARVEMRPDGTAVAYVGTSPHGQGHDTSFAMILADELGIPMDRVVVVHGDTDLVASGAGTFGSRSLQLGGSALREAAVALCQQGRIVAARALGLPEHDVDLDRTSGRWHGRQEPHVGLAWGELATLHGALSADGKFDSTTTVPFGAHLAVVEVDSETGRVALLRYVAVDDAGRLLNPMIADGQRHGGIAQGIGQALFEAVLYDEDGNPLTASLADYTQPAARDLPSFELVPMETPSPLNPLGAKGIGEAGAVGAPPAVQNAVVDAVSHLGVRHIDMPLTPWKVWKAVRDARQARGAD